MKNRGIRRQLNYEYDYNAGLSRPRERTQRLYRVQRRKDIIKDYYSFGVRHNTGLNDQLIAKNFSYGIKHFRELEVRLEQGSNDLIIRHLLKTFSRTNLPKIKTLRLRMASWYVLEAFEGQFSALKSRFPNLENFHVIFNQMHGKKDIPIQDFTIRPIRRLSHKLKHLSLQFSYSGFFKDNHLNIISQALKSPFRCLESLELVFAGLSPDLSERAVQNLFKSLLKISNLKKFQLYGEISSSKIDEEASAILCSAILCSAIQRWSTTLEVLKINAGSSKILRNSYQRLCQVLTNILPKIQHLELKFPSQESMDDDGLATFGGLLGNGSNSLEILDLYFSSSQYGISNHGAQDFAEGITKGSFPMMERLTICINYPHNSRLADDGLYAIAEAIPLAFPNLRYLKLIFGSNICPKVAEKAKKMLKEKLKNLPEQWHLYW